MNSETMFINDNGYWECRECGAMALLYGLHRPGCLELDRQAYSAGGVPPGAGRRALADEHATSTPPRRGAEALTMSLADCLACVGPGWLGLVTRCWDACQEHGVMILHVKEKYGGLRFYFGGAPLAVYDIIDAAEKESYTICERCGQPGKLRGGGWYQTLCDEHAG